MIPLTEQEAERIRARLAEMSIAQLALGKAQARIAELEAELEVKKAQVNDAVTSGAKLANAVGRLVACKGRYHTEQNYNQLVEALEAYRENR